METTQIDFAKQSAYLPLVNFCLVGGSMKSYYEIEADEVIISVSEDRKTLTIVTYHPLSGKATDEIYITSNDPIYRTSEENLWGYLRDDYTMMDIPSDDLHPIDNE